MEWFANDVTKKRTCEYIRNDTLRKDTKLVLKDL